MRVGDLTSEGRLFAVLLAVFGGVALLAAIDVSSDLRDGSPFGHVATESVIFALGLFGTIAMARRLRGLLADAQRLEARAAALEDQLEASREEATRWRDEARELLLGLGAAIDRQLERWGLSPAEKEVALLLLKGLSHKEIAQVRGVTEATARQQARAVYKKAGLSGRNDLSALFLEDLLLPVEPPVSARTPQDPS